MDKLIWCKKYKINVNPEADCMCPICIFWGTITNKFGYKYRKCFYKDWKPGLKKGREW